MDERTLTIINAEWRQVAPRLLRFVKRKIGNSLLQNGHDAEDVVQMAFERLLDGSRSWDPDKVDLETHMKCSILRSMLSSKGLLSIKGPDSVEFTEEEDLNRLDLHGVHISDLSRDPISGMDKATAFNMLEGEIQGDKELRDVLAAIRLGCRKPADVAEMTGIEIKRVYWLQQKLTDSAENVATKLLK